MTALAHAACATGKAFPGQPFHYDHAAFPGTACDEGHYSIPFFYGLQNYDRRKYIAEKSTVWESRHWSHKPLQIHSLQMLCRDSPAASRIKRNLVRRRLKIFDEALFHDDVVPPTPAVGQDPTGRVCRCRWTRTMKFSGSGVGIPPGIRC